MNQLIDKALTVVLSPVAPLVLGVLNIVAATNTIMYVTGIVLLVIGLLEWYENWKVNK